VLTEVALAVVLVVGAGLLINSFLRLMRVDAGFAPDRLVTFNADISLKRYPNPADQARYLNSLLENVRRTPGVEAAGACTSLPPNVVQQSSVFSIDNEPVTTSSPRAWNLPATPGFTEALGLPLIRGRTIADSDDASAAPVAMINRALSERYFADRDPIGQRVNFVGAARTIVGVVGDTRYDGLAAPPGFQIYLPYAQRTFPGMFVVVRSKTDPRALTGAMREAVRQTDSQAQGSRYRTMTEILNTSINEPRFYTLLLGTFGLVALALASIGIFGVISYSVAQRTKEIGVRVALGASRASVLGMVLRQSIRVIGAGVILGVIAAFGLTRLLEGLLFEVRPTDPVTFASVVALLLAVGLAAAFFPARRAARVDPIEALRCE
jgi:putative ABC transport system permease protein